MFQVLRWLKNSKTSLHVWSEHTTRMSRSDIHWRTPPTHLQSNRFSLFLHKVASLCYVCHPLLFILFVVPTAVWCKQDFICKRLIKQHRPRRLSSIEDDRASTRLYKSNENSTFAHFCLCSHSQLHSGVLCIWPLESEKEEEVEFLLKMQFKGVKDGNFVWKVGKYL